VSVVKLKPKWSLANQKGPRQSSGPIRTRSKRMWLTGNARLLTESCYYFHHWELTVNRLTRALFRLTWMIFRLMHSHLYGYLYKVFFHTESLAFLEWRESPESIWDVKCVVFDYNYHDSLLARLLERTAVTCDHILHKKRGLIADLDRRQNRIDNLMP